MRRRGRRRSQSGAATAELALTLPLLAAVTLALVWLLTLGVAQVRLVDAARETARAVARGESVEDAVALGARIAPDGAEISVSPGETIRVRASSRVVGPGGVLGALPAARLTAEAVAAAEPGS